MKQTLAVALATLWLMILLAWVAPTHALEGGVLAAAASAEFLGQAGDEAGVSVAGAGDVNGDGYDDLVVGATGNSGGGSDAGAAYLIPGGPAGWSLNMVLGQAPSIQYNGQANDFAGADVAVTRHFVHPCNEALMLQMPIWDVESGKMASTTTLDLRFEYTNGQLGDMAEANLKLFARESGHPCSAWTEVPGSAVDANTNAVTATGLTGLGQFTIADALPSPTMIEIGGLTATSAPHDLVPAALFLGATAVSGATILRRRRQRGHFAQGFLIEDE